MSDFDDFDPRLDAPKVPLSQRAMAARGAPYLDDLNPADFAAARRARHARRTRQRHT